MVLLGIHKAKIVKNVQINAKNVKDPVLNNALVVKIIHI
jgi:hypothetical protein